MKEKLLLRERYGKSAYVTIFPDGQQVPWLPLSIGDYLYYERLEESGQYPTAFLENEIFTKCVLNPVLTKQIGKLKAGVVSIVADHIKQYSSPQTLQELEAAMNISRLKASRLIHDMVNHVCQAYPAYKPEDVYQMDAETFMMRVATAERKLLSTGIIKAPINFEQDAPSKPVRQKPTTRLAPQSQPPPVNMAKAYQEQQRPSKTIITKDDISEGETVYTGHERADKIVLEQKMVDDTSQIYGDYIKQMNEGKKITIKTPEERKAAALKQAEVNRKNLEVKAKQLKEADKAEMERLAKMRKVKRTVKRRR